MSIEPFEIRVPQSTLDDLSQRLRATRWPDDDASATDWDAGPSPAYLRDLCAYWVTGFDWRAREAELNRFRQCRAVVGETIVHFIHERGRGDDPLPLILTHGFPDSFARFSKLIPLLTDPAAHGGNASDAFDVVVPSLPGYAFSELRHKHLFSIGDLWHHLMTNELDYRRFGAHGGDWGSVVTEQLARHHPGSLVGIHLTDVPFWHAFQRPADLGPSERDYFAAQQQFLMQHGAYAMLQSTRPQTLADALNDSPAGLATWMVDLFQRWSDCDGNIETRFTKDELLTNVMLYWARQAIASSLTPYYDITHAGAARWMLEKAREWVASSTEVPAGFALFPKDLSQPPREWAERFFKVERWTRMARGGHFAALEEPEMLAADIRTFFRPLRASRAPAGGRPS